MPKQRYKQHAVASTPRFIAPAQPVLSEQSFPLAAITEQQKYGGQLSRPSRKATYSCNRCRSRSLTCDSHVYRPCTNCLRSDLSEPCESLPMNSFEVFIKDEPHIHQQPIVPDHQYVESSHQYVGDNHQYVGDNHQYGGNSHQYGGNNYQYGGNNHQYGGNNHQYMGEHGLPVGQIKQEPWEEDQREVTPWENEAELVSWGSVELNGQAVGTAEEPMSITEMDFGALDLGAAGALGDPGPDGAWGFGGGERLRYGNSRGANGYHH